jgi:hypothetical protein
MKNIIPDLLMLINKMSNKGVSDLETCMDYFGLPVRF